MTESTEALIPYEDMLKAGMHFGRRKTVFNPAMKSYVFSVRDGICIIDLLKTQEKVQEGLEFLKKSLGEGKLILFVAPTKQAQESTRKLAEALDMPFVVERWLGGILTNFKVINARVKRLIEMEQLRATGGLDKYTKKERLLFDREIAKMTTHFSGLKKLTRLPDLMFVASVKEGKLAIHEARKMGVKVVGIVNTDADPNLVSVGIPANDRSKMSVDLIVDYLTQELSKSRIVS